MEKEISIISSGIVLNESITKILLIRRQDRMWDNAWSIPGGHIEFRELVINALKRELREELALKILKIEFLNYEEFYSKIKDRYYISLNFIVIAKEGIKIDKNEIKEAKWFTLKEIDSIEHNVPKKGVDYIKRHLSNP